MTNNNTANGDLNMHTNKYKAKGQMVIRIGKHMIEMNVCDKDFYMQLFEHICKDQSKRLEIVEQMYEEEFNDDIYELFDGHDFLAKVRDDGITDFDGTIVAIYIDGYRSNLGLCDYGIISGDFMVCAEIFDDICNTHKVEVNWYDRKKANRVVE